MSLWKTLLLPVILLFFPVTLEAQRHASGSLIINPLLDERHHLPDDETRAFNTFGGWSGFGTYPYSSDDHHLWYQELGGYVELWRRGSTTSLLLTGQIQFIADPHNAINFNPRAIFWEEGLLHTTHLQNGYLQLGFMHRCKHDIDNLERGEERSLIFSSFMARYQRPVRLFTPDDLMIMTGFERYLITWDRRTPRELEAHPPDWNDLNRKLTLHLHWRANPHGSGAFTETQLNLIQAGSDFFVNREASIGWQFHRSGGAFRMELKYEYLHDSGIPATPAEAHLLSFGIWANSPFVFR